MDNSLGNTYHATHFEIERNYLSEGLTKSINTKAMNIEDLAKGGKAKTPAKKKGYDDVEISDLSLSEKKSKKIEPKILKDEAKGDKKDKKTIETRTEKTNEKTHSPKSDDVQRTPVIKTEEKTPRRNANVMSIPKYTGGPISAGSDTPKKGNCCTLL
ncbi:unnamed protein product [Cylicocyclus nassatus]|uniref:Uncharacterized protein n=1 Tax=Cylicocyclus nassatus TaxID=53992 RepID=A0AA36GLG4_CYLNA|nr:unnamed protein product [Cylicocyclus nassatus]